jgi:phosphorylcholine metabolism protein LicD
MENKKFSLKDELFNQDKVEFIANNISQIYGGFDKNAFIKETIQKFPELELKQRIFHIRDMLDKYLDTNYLDCLDILLKSLPKELDPNLTDNDFGYFILSPY